MPQLLALEWDDSEARVAVASRRGHQTVIEQAFLIPLRSALPEAGQPEQDIGQQIAEALGARNIGQLDALVAVGRGSVELRQLQLPAATDDELPKMVRLQALMEFNELDEKWLLDFIPVGEAGKSSRTVLAAAIAPGLIDRIQAVCQRSSLTMRRLVLRSCSAAALAARAQRSVDRRKFARLPNATPQQSVDVGQVQLLVELFSDRADLTVAVDGKVIFLRTLRLDGGTSDASRSQSLLAGIRLTTAAVQNQFGGRQVTRIVLCGRGEADAALAEQIEKETGTHTALFDPLAGLELGPQLRASPCERPGRLAAVLGMLLTELDQAAPAIDFLHPRHAVEPANPRKKWKLAAVAAALLALAYLSCHRMAYWRLESDLQQLEARFTAADKVLVNADGNKIIASVKEIAKWADGEIMCLDQLRALSEDFPPAEKATLGHWTLAPVSVSSGADVYGRMHLEGWARDNEAVTFMEQSLRAHGRRVEGSTTNEDRTLSPYSSKFNTTVLVRQGSKP